MKLKPAMTRAELKTAFPGRDDVWYDWMSTGGSLTIKWRKASALDEGTDLAVEHMLFGVATVWNGQAWIPVEPPSKKLERRTRSKLRFALKNARRNVTRKKNRTIGNGQKFIFFAERLRD